VHFPELKIFVPPELLIDTLDFESPVVIVVFPLLVMVTVEFAKAGDTKTPKKRIPDVILIAVFFTKLFIKFHPISFDNIL
jgi:hypothetical protein